MPYEEAVRSRLGDRRASYYEQNLNEARTRESIERFRHVIKAEEQPWEETRFGRIKWLVHESMEDVPIKDIEIYILSIPPGGKSGKHRHTAEEFCYVLEGGGYDIHWDLEPVFEGDSVKWVVSGDPKVFNWEEGDMIYIPPVTIHQHFNTGNSETRLLCAMSTIYKVLGFNDIEDVGD